MGTLGPVEKIALSLAKLREQGEFRFVRRSEGHAVHAYSLSGMCENSATALLEIPEGVFLLAVNVEGTLLMRCRSEERWTIASSGTITFLPGSQRLVACFGRGKHETDLFWWSERLTPQIGSWLRSESVGRSSGRVVNCRSISPTFEPIVERLNEALGERMPRQEMLFLSAVYELVPRLAHSVHELRIAPLPQHLPGPLREIAAQVALQPQNPWAIRDASALVGYSPFHFCRVFKQLVGYGFHEYVDRCRTELAVDKLCNTKATAEEISHLCGFGTAHTMRDSIREHLGITPTELRTTTEE